MVFSIAMIFLLSSNIALADNSDTYWKIDIKKNNTESKSTIFWPPELQARQNETIMWINNDTTAHTITSGVTDHLNYSGKIFDSGILNPEQTYLFKIPSGQWSAYYYFCKIHPWMTGKIDVGVAYLGSSPVFTIMTDKRSYTYNETIQISGKVNDTSQVMPMKIQIFDSKRNMVFSDRVGLSNNFSFNYKLKASDSIFKTTGNYKIKALYGFPATVTDVNFALDAQNEQNTSTNSNIPYWIKNTAKWWSQNQINDDDFMKGIQFLVTSGELKVNASHNPSIKSDTIPSWIKSSAGWWSSGSISDKEFMSCVQYLIDHNIINA